MREWMRPELERVIKWRIAEHDPDASRRWFKVTTEYTDAKGRRQPAYAATHIRVHAYFVASNEPLDPLEVGLRTISELETLERVEEGERGPAHNPLRPQVIALVRRRVEVRAEPEQV